MKPLFTSAAGIKYRWDDSQQADGHFTVHAEQDVTAMLDRNKAMANHNDGWMQGGGKMGRRLASIPNIVAQKWLVEEGLDIYDPDHSDRLMKKLNCSDWAHLRTAHWNCA